ncbi:MAG: hypothetical protein IKO56_02265 [Alphaproteobacteria bacterium]|nr:hypothetical protein [Alphaproteobacteria bacterium]
MSSLKENGANISSLKNDLRLLFDKYKGVTINDMLDAVKSLKFENNIEQKAKEKQEAESNEQQYCDMVFWQ